MCERYYVDDSMIGRIKKALSGIDNRLNGKTFSGDIYPTNTAPVISAASDHLQLEENRWGYPGENKKYRDLRDRAEGRGKTAGYVGRPDALPCNRGVCEDERLKMALNLSFAGSLRLGELLGLTWDCVDVTQESIDRGMASIFITKELQRTSKSTLSQLDDKDILVKFPKQGTRNKTVLVLKSPRRRPASARYSFRRPRHRCWWAGRKIRI